MAFSEEIFQFKHPFTMLVVGPTSCGKTNWIQYLLNNIDVTIKPTPKNIIFFYKRWQPMYTQLSETISNIRFVEGLNIDETDSIENSLCIYDDLMAQTSKNESICELFTEGSHHKNVSVICLLQNLYNKGKENRTMNLNSQYLILFKNPRDLQQISVLARQMYPGKSQRFMDKFVEATTKPYGYLLVDLKQNTKDKDRLKPNVFNTVECAESQDLVKKTIVQNDVESNKHKQQSVSAMCVHCGVLFASPSDVLKHKNICLQTDEIQSQSEISHPSEERNTQKTIIFNLWEPLISRVIEKNQEVYDNYGNTNIPPNELNKKLKTIYIRSLMDIYKEFIQNINSWNQDKIYSTIMETIEMFDEDESDEGGSDNSYDNLKSVIEENISEFESIIDHFSLE